MDMCPVCRHVSAVTGWETRRERWHITDGRERLSHMGENFCRMRNILGEFRGNRHNLYSVDTRNSPPGGLLQTNR